MRTYFDEQDDYEADIHEAFDEPTLMETVTEATLGAAERLIGEIVVDANDDNQKQLGVLLFDDVTPADVAEVTVTDIRADAQSTDFTIYDQYEGGTVAIRAAIEALVEFEGYSHTTRSGDYEVVDEDWDEGVMLISFARRVRMWFDLIIIGTDVESVTFDHAEIA